MIDRLRWLISDGDEAARQARVWLKIGLLGLLFIALFQIIPVDQFVATLLSARFGPLAGGLLLGLPASLLTSVQLTLLVRMQGIRLGLPQIFGINLATKFYTLVTPGSIIGSGIRWMKISSPQTMPVESLAALAFFRLMEFFLTVALGTGFFLLGGQGTPRGTSWLIALLLFLILGWAAATKLSTGVIRWLNERTSPEEYSSLAGRMMQHSSRFITALATYAEVSPGELALAVLAGVASQLLSIYSALCLAKSVGIDMTFLQMGWVNAAVLLATQLPFGLAGGLGLREATLVALLPTQGIPAPSALALSLLQFLRWVLLAAIGGGWEAAAALRKRSASAREDGKN
jgi:uncharacterized protein (TIRG00374 family)